MGLATIGNIIEVTPGDDLNLTLDENTWEFVSDWSPFQFRVETKLYHEALMYGLAGPVVAGHERYAGLTCSILLRCDEADWHTDVECCAGLKVAPGIALPVLDYNPEEWAGAPFHLHPDGTLVNGYPRITTFGDVRIAPNLG